MHCHGRGQPRARHRPVLRALGAWRRRRRVCPRQGETKVAEPRDRRLCDGRGYVHHRRAIWLSPGVDDGNVSVYSTDEDLFVDLGVGGDCRLDGRWACGPVCDGTGGPRIVRSRLDGRRGWRQGWRRPWRRRYILGVAPLVVGQRAGEAPCAGGWVNVVTSPDGNHGRPWKRGCGGSRSLAPPGPRTGCLGVARAKRVRRPLGLGRAAGTWARRGARAGPWAKAAAVTWSRGCVVAAVLVDGRGAARYVDGRGACPSTRVAGEPWID